MLDRMNILTYFDNILFNSLHINFNLKKIIVYNLFQLKIQLNILNDFCFCKTLNIFLFGSELNLFVNLYYLHFWPVWIAKHKLD